MVRQTLILVVFALLPLQVAHAQASRSFGGRVFEAQSKRGIQSLEVKLRPPTGSTVAVMIGTTDQNGAFRFAQVRIGVYLVEVSQGPYLLYRGEVDISRQDTIDIPIERR